MRVVIICHFSNETVRSKLRFAPYHEKYNDSANWITTIINGLKYREDIELHIVAPHRGIHPKIQEFEYDDVHYHFFRRYILPPFDKLERRFFPQDKKGFPKYRSQIRSFIAKIQPDIVNLIGAENAYYASAALDFNDIPVFVHCQTVYANPERKGKTGKVDPIRWNTEIQIFNHVTYYACTGQLYYDLIKSYQPKAIIFPRKWPSMPYPEIPEVEKRYDFVFFARYLNKNKGFDNALEAMGLFTQAYPEVRLLAVGGRDNEWSKYESRIKELGLEKNLEIHESFPEYKDLLRYVKQARFALLPITMDVISGTILEAMRMGMPVVTCRTSGTPLLNKERETVLISEIGDFEGLFQNMKRLFDTENLQNALRENAFIFLKEEEAKNARNVDAMIAQYKAVIAHYREGVPVPQELLFRIENNKSNNEV